MAANERIRVIDNKRVLMTDDEHSLYESICKAYDNPPHQQGKALFENLFETDANGMITMLRPPTKICSFEVFLFVMALMTHQHLRDCYKQVNAASSNVDRKLTDLTKRVEEKLAELDKAIKATKEKTQ